MSNLSTDPQPVTITPEVPPVTNPNTANAPLGSAARVNFGARAPLPTTATPLTPVRVAPPSAPNSRVSTGPTRRR